MIVPPIEESFVKLTSYPSVTERYYTKYVFTPPAAQPDEQHCILVHSNRICLITLAEAHPIVRNKKTIKKIDFQVNDKVDRLKNKVSGKGKKGAQSLQPSSLLCYIECDDNSRYVIYGCVKGKLVEVNLNLLKSPELLIERPLSDGFIAIVLPHLKDIEKQKEEFTLCDEVKTFGCSDLLDVD